MEYGWFTRARVEADIKTAGIIDVLMNKARQVGKSIQDVMKSTPSISDPNAAMEFAKPQPIKDSGDIVSAIKFGIAPFLRYFEVKLMDAKKTVSQLDDCPEKALFMREAIRVIAKIKQNNTKLRATPTNLGKCDALKKYRAAQSILHTVEGDLVNLQDLADQAKTAIDSDTTIYIYTDRAKSIFDNYLSNTEYESMLNEYSAKHGC